jgi:hypothetical protein
MPELVETPASPIDAKPKSETQVMLENIDTYLKSIGAKDAYQAKPQEKPKATMRPLTEEELAAYNKKKADSEAAMAEWKAKREKEMEAEGGPSWKLLCELRAKEAEKKAAGVTGPALITKATAYGDETNPWKIE